MQRHMRWQPDFAERVVQSAADRGLVTRDADRLHLTEPGRHAARLASLT